MKLTLILLLACACWQVQGKGKTYDDLDDIIKHQAEGRISSRESHKSYQEPKGQGTKVDPTKVVHKAPKVDEESGHAMAVHAVTSNKTKVYTKYASSDPT